MAKSLPPWLQEAKGEKMPPKGAKVSAIKGPKGAVSKVTVPVKKADGGKVEKTSANKAANQKGEALSDPKIAANKRNTASKPVHLKDGGKAKC